jgi:dTDP-4-dehydrorhamnose 3,5-epimerase
LRERFKVNIKIEKCPAYHDNRGDLIQFVTHQVLTEEGLPFGQVYLLTFEGKGTIRGNHYHNRSSEMFCLISGSVQMVFEEVDTQNRLEKTITVTHTEFSRISIGPKIAHAIKSLSDFAVMVSFSSKEYDLTEDDKIFYSLIG